MPTRKNFPGRKKARREQAEEQKEARAQRTNAQQLKLLDQRLGKNKGAKKERARLKNET